MENITGVNNLELLQDLTEEEKQEVLKILQEVTEEGKSNTYNELLEKDYDEIPVDIETFLKDKRYLGKGLVNEEGTFTVFNFWVKTLKEIFPDPLKPATCSILALTGSIGIGKSFMAVLCGLYELYRMLCLKNPYVYYGLQPIDKITFAFMNITLDASKGVAWDKMQQLLQTSEWFMEKGTVTGTVNQEWHPPKGIELIAGSLSRHIIGRAVFFCLDGNTEILTKQGARKISTLVDKNIQVYSVNEFGEIELSNYCTVKQTACSNIEYKILLEDKTEIKCTAEHRFMLSDGTYREVQDLCADDLLYGQTLSIEKQYVRIFDIERTILDEPKAFYDVLNANPYNNFLIKTDTGYVCSHNCFQDEVSFRNNQDVEKQKEQAKALVNTALARMQSRFMKGEVNPTLMVLASSKRTEQSYMETFIKQKQENDLGTTKIIDEPQWVIREDKDSPIKFKVAVGNKFLSSEVVPLDVSEKELQLYRDRGYTLIDVPMGYYENFIDDIDIALTDIAGISTSSSSRYFSGPRVAKVRSEEIQNGFIRDIIEVGNNPEDTTQYIDYFDIDRIDKSLLNKPLYIHMDMSISGDKTGICGTWILGKKPSTDENNMSKDLLYRPAFCVSVKAPKGFQISFEKNRNFIYQLKELGFNIKGVSSDTFQSADTLQQLQAHGFNTTIISVDRVDTDRICKPYQMLRSVVYEERIQLFSNKLLIEELISLERNNNTGKIDHTKSGLVDSKDSSDALCGSVWNASQHAEEFDFEYGDTLEALIDISSMPSVAVESEVQQMTVSFEEELMRVSNEFRADVVNKTEEENNTTSSLADDFFIYEGIII